jgi:hypothetical protein
VIIELDAGESDSGRYWIVWGLCRDDLRFLCPYPRPPQFAEDMLQTLYDGLKHRPETTQGTGLADVMADKNPLFHRRDFASLMRNS